MLSQPFQRLTTPPRQLPRTKPHGRWYSVGPAWLDWVRTEMPGWERKLHFRLTLDRSRLLVLSTVDEMMAFTHEFTDKDCPLRERHPGVTIDWKRVAESYGGIEVSEYDSSYYPKPMWYSMWDCASGVVWDDSVILAIEPITRKSV